TVNPFNQPDTTPPVVTKTPAGDQTVDATSADGAVVTWTTNATDPDDTAGPVTCTPKAPGDTFPIAATHDACPSTPPPNTPPPLASPPPPPPRPPPPPPGRRRWPNRAPGPSPPPRPPRPPPRGQPPPPPPPPPPVLSPARPPAARRSPSAPRRCTAARPTRTA